MRQQLIVCARRADLARPYAPAAEADCGWCGAGIWLGYAVVQDVPGGLAVCNQCVDARLMHGNADTTFVVTPNVRKAVVAHLRKSGLS